MKIIDPAIQRAINKTNMHKLQSQIESQNSLKKASLEINRERLLNSLEMHSRELSNPTEQDQTLMHNLISILDLFLHVNRVWNMWDTYPNKRELESTLSEHSLYYGNACASSWQARVSDNEKLIFGSLYRTEWDLILTSTLLIGMNFSNSRERSFVFSLPLKKSDVEEFLKLTEPNYNSQIESWLTRQ